MNMKFVPQHSEIASDHQALGAMVREVKADLDRLQCDPCGRQPAFALRNTLHQMHQRLERHFAHEEAGWSSTKDRDPSSERWVRTLTKQHRDFESRMRDILDELDRDLKAGGPLSVECNAAMRAVLTDLTAHELSEDRLLQRAIFEGLEGA